MEIWGLLDPFLCAKKIHNGGKRLFLPGDFFPTGLPPISVAVTEIKSLLETYIR
jgi:hypothetical protein